MAALFFVWIWSEFEVIEVGAEMKITQRNLKKKWKGVKYEFEKNFGNNLFSYWMDRWNVS